MSKEDEKGSFLDENHDGKGGSVFQRIRAYFLAGIFVTAPIGITIYLTWIFLRFVDRRVTAFIPEAYDPFNLLPFSVPGIEFFKSILSLVVAILFFVMVGWFARNFLGRLIYRIAEYIVDRMPVIRNVYGALKQIFETIMASQSQAFRDVVMFEYPRKGVWALGFVTGTTKGEVQRLTDSEVVNVFLPTTPNPTSGFLLFIPKKDVTYMDMSVEEGIKMIVSGGIITPPDRTGILKPKEGDNAGARKAEIVAKNITGAERGEGESKTPRRSATKKTAKKAKKSAKKTAKKSVKKSAKKS